MAYFGKEIAQEVYYFFNERGADFTFNRSKQGHSKICVYAVKYFFKIKGNRKGHKEGVLFFKKFR